MTCRIVFFGSPEFALPILESLAQLYSVVGVVTQPGRPSGRGRRIKHPPVKDLAVKSGIPVIQPKDLREEWAFEQLVAWEPDLIVVAAFGQILRKNVLDLPPYKCINVHASLLPRWRGAAPIPAAILAGDEKTGATIMIMDEGIDTGPILNQSAVAIDTDETSASLSKKLSHSGAKLLLDTIPGYLNQSIQPVKQKDSLATYAPMLKKVNGRLDFSQEAILLERQVRAYEPWPGTYMIWDDAILKILRASVELPEDDMAISLDPGTRVEFNNKPAVTTALGLLILDDVQPAGKKRMAGESYLRGAKNWTEITTL